MKKQAAVTIGICAALWMLTGATSPEPANGPHFNSDGQLQRPENYREWIFLSSGIGMTYGPAAAAAGTGSFDNVFVNPESYKVFKETGHWPDKTIFILEIRSSETHGSINKAGAFQTDIVAVEAAVKDESRFPEKWGYFSFSDNPATLATSAKRMPATSSCNSCHRQNAAVENTFVQFYPALYEIAEKRGTFNPSFPRLALTPMKLFHTVAQEGWPKAEIALAETRTREPKASVLQENQLNLLAYRLLRADKKAEAIQMLTWATQQYPKSANLQDSLAEIYHANGQKAEARASTEKALALLESDQSIDADRRARVTKALNDRLKELDAK